MQLRIPLLALAALFLPLSVAVHAAAPPNDVRLQPLKDLDGYFPFTPPKTKAEWDQRAEYVRRQVLVSQGLWPLPTRTPLNAVIHGKIERPDYTVEKVYFESVPGLFVTGNLYRPKKVTGKVPGVLFAHGHWQDARLSLETDQNLRQEIATGQERFEQGGKSRFQSMCVQLARMGCVVWQWDMLSDSDAVQLSKTVVHRFAKQRPEMNTTENWGLYSPQAEAHLQSVMGLQTWNAVRSLDFLLSLPEVDPERTAITGASGGGTQTMLLAAIDPRVKLSFPAVMVSTAMQGGCTCENASLLRVGTGNVEFAGLFAPKPQGMTTADDWTKEMATKGFPQLKQLYALLGAPDHVMLHRGEHFPHNYNAVSRSAFYTWLNRHFKLGFPEPVIEKDYETLSPAQLTVWDAEHPKPKADDPDLERRVLKWLADDAEKQLRAAAASPESRREVLGKALEVVIGRTLATAGETEWQQREQLDRGTYLQRSGVVRNRTHGEELPVTVLQPKQTGGRVVLWLDTAGKSALFQPNGALRPAVEQLLKGGATVIGADLLFQGDFNGGAPVGQTRKVANPREFAGYTFGYNHALFAQRAHDVLTLVKHLRDEGLGLKPSSVSVAAFGEAGPIAAAARAVAGEGIDRAALDTGGFRFGKLLDFRHPQFLPGGAKYLDLPGFLTAAAPQPLWLAGEGEQVELVSGVYRAAGQGKLLTTFSGDASRKEAAAAKWLLE
ncbi:MAG: dienelactone hydrolase family protein [Armatimonadota bacterium]